MIQALLTVNRMFGVLKVLGWSVHATQNSRSFGLMLSPPYRLDFDPIEGAVFFDNPKTFVLHIDPFMEFQPAADKAKLDWLTIKS
jgi:hypothetical protein